jgi:hypothetical protein
MWRLDVWFDSAGAHETSVMLPTVGAAARLISDSIPGRHLFLPKCTGIWN